MKQVTGWADEQEYFVKHFMEEGYTRARLDNRKLITYKDLGRSLLSIPCPAEMVCPEQRMTDLLADLQRH